MKVPTPCSLSEIEEQKEFPEAHRLTSVALEAQKLQRDPGLKIDRSTTSTGTPQHTSATNTYT